MPQHVRLALATAALSASVGGFVCAATVTIPPAIQDPAKVPSGTYELNGQHSQVIFRIMHLNISPYYGRIQNPTGVLNLDAAHVEKSRLAVEIDMRTVSTTVDTLDGEIKAPKGFNVAQFPTAKFQSTAIHRTGPKTADVTGNLTFRGVTKPVTLHATFTGALQMPWANNAWEIGFSVLGTIKRSDFGMNEGTWAGVSDSVDLLIAGEFGQKP